MLRIVDNHYGEDIDGNRGVTRISYEIEAEDEPQIKEQVQEYVSSLSEDEDPEDTIEVVLIDPVDEIEVYFTVRVKDYACGHS